VGGDLTVISLLAVILSAVTPATARTQLSTARMPKKLDPGLRRGDGTGRVD